MKKHFYELAKEIGVPSKKLLDEVKELGLSVKSHMSVISEEDYQVIKNLFLEQKKEEKEEEKKTKKEKVKKNTKATCSSSTGTCRPWKNYLTRRHKADKCGRGRER